MNVYFSGLGGVGVGPLTEIARDAGHTVMGSDLAESLVTQELQEQGVSISIGQDGTFLQACHEATPLDWFVYTSSLADDHPELLLAQKLGIRISKRDEFLAYIIQEKGLKLIAIAGTHGKTTTTGMMVWTMKQLGIPVSYSIGTTISFGSSGAYDPDSDYFVYECDEYDRNFLNFNPDVALLTSVDYDHPDTFPTEQEYVEAFQQFVHQSAHTIAWKQDDEYLNHPAAQSWILSETLPLTLAGAHNRANGTLVLKALEYLELANLAEATDALNGFPGTDRRFERLAQNLYTDYGHHPKEIAATIQMAREISDHVVLVYQPHQNRRQHRVKDLYIDQFEGAEHVYWLPTYLTREDPMETILQPNELFAGLSNRDVVREADLNESLWGEMQEHRKNGALVLCMGAGTIDAWVRQQLSQASNQS